MIILTHTTALHVLRHLGAEALAYLPRHEIEDLGDACDRMPRAVDRYRRFSEQIGAPLVPLHIARPRGCHLGSASHAKVHRLPEDCGPCLLLLSEGVYCVTPELLARQLAPWGSLHDLTYLLYELCGVYSHPRNEGIAIADRESFTTRVKLEQFIEGCSAFPSAGKMRDAIALVRDRSASPMETACAMLLGLPYRYGGYAFPDFEMNREIEVPAWMRPQVGRSKMVADLCWFDKKVVLEYDSSQWHHGAVQVAKDSSRRNVLSRLGFSVVTLTGVQMSQEQGLKLTSRTLAEALGHSIRIRYRDFEDRRQMLEWVVLKDRASIFSPFVNERNDGLHPRILD